MSVFRESPDRRGPPSRCHLPVQVVQVGRRRPGGGGGRRRGRVRRGGLQEQPGRRVPVGRRGGPQGHDHHLQGPLGPAEEVRQGAPPGHPQLPAAQPRQPRVQAADRGLPRQRRHRLRGGPRAPGPAGRARRLPPALRTHRLLHHHRHGHEARHTEPGQHVRAVPAPHLPQLQDETGGEGEELHLTC